MVIANDRGCSAEVNQICGVYMAMLIVRYMTNNTDESNMLHSVLDKGGSYETLLYPNIKKARHPSSSKAIECICNREFTDT